MCLKIPCHNCREFTNIRMHNSSLQDWMLKKNQNRKVELLCIVEHWQSVCADSDLTRMGFLKANFCWKAFPARALSWDSCLLSSTVRGLISTDPSLPGALPALKVTPESQVQWQREVAFHSKHQLKQGGSAGREWGGEPDQLLCSLTP